MRIEQLAVGSLGAVVRAALELRLGEEEGGGTVQVALVERTHPSEGRARLVERRRFRDYLKQPTWGILLTMAALYALGIFLVNWDLTRENVGWVLAWPARVGEKMFGEVDLEHARTLKGALKRTGYHLVNLTFLYLMAALLLWVSREPSTSALVEADDADLSPIPE